MPLVERYEAWIKTQADVSDLNAQQRLTTEQLLCNAQAQPAHCPRHRGFG